MPRQKRQPKCDPVTAYARSVVDGDPAATCELVKLACRRHLDDLVNATQRGLRWDPERAQCALDFFPTFLCHSKGEWAGQPVELSPWQQFIVGCLFGWLLANGARRFRIAYTEVPRKNGKSTFAAGLGIYLAFFAGEPGAEVYTAATKRDQARIVHSEAVRMVKRSPELKSFIKPYRDNLSNEETASKYEPLGADADTLDGLNPSAAIVDELHAHKTREMLDVLETGTGARRQPLIFVITTAGVGGAPSVGLEMHEYAEGVLKGQLKDDTFFAFIAAIDDGDDWLDEDAWKRANPNLGVSCKLDDLRAKANKAKAMPTARATFMQKHLDRWVQSSEVWIPDDQWMKPANAEPFGEASLEGQDCYGGLDLANSLDLAALCLLFPSGKTEPLEIPVPVDQTAPPDQDKERPSFSLAANYTALFRFWCPEQRVEEREGRHRASYAVWKEAGLLVVTDGDVTDYDWIRRDVNDLTRRFRLRELAYDPFNATQLALQLTTDAIVCKEFTQSIRNFNEPMVGLERLVKQGRIRHGGHPVARWNLGNVVTRRNGLGQIMPDRKRSKDKIDGVVALLEALARAMLAPTEAAYGMEVWG